MDRRAAVVRKSAGSRTEAAREPAPSFDDPGVRGVAIAIAVVLAARAALAFTPGTWGWSLALQRFLDPLTAWTTWAIAAAALLPRVARRVLPFVTRIGDAIADRPALAALGFAVAGGAIAWAWPDRVWFVGDFLLRQGTVELSERYAALFPQALPLDVWLHVHLPTLLRGGAGLDANAAARLIGILDAMLMGALACGFARAVGLRGAAAFVCAAGVLFGGHLAMFTGFGKAFAELCVIVVAVGVLGVRVAADGRGALALGVVTAIGVTLHRSGLGLVPAVAVAMATGLAPQGRWKRPEALAGILIAAVAVLVMTPRIAGIVGQWDRGHFAPEPGAGALASALSPVRLLDLVNVFVVLAPLALILPALLPAVRAGALRGAAKETRVLVALALPFLAFAAALHPGQGAFRDTDVFAASGATLALVAAFVVGRVLAARPRWAIVAPALALAAIVPTVQWLALHADLDRGLTRARAFLVEPPRRPEALVAKSWDFLGNRNFRLGRWDEAAEAYGRAAEFAPSPRILLGWALAKLKGGHTAEARDLYRRVVARDPRNDYAWWQLAVTSAALGDRVEASRAADTLDRLTPENPRVEALRVVLARGDSAAAAR